MANIIAVTSTTISDYLKFAKSSLALNATTEDLLHWIGGTIKTLSSGEIRDDVQDIIEELLHAKKYLQLENFGPDKEAILIHEVATNTMQHC